MRQGCGRLPHPGYERPRNLVLLDDMTRTALFLLCHGRTLSFEQQSEPTLQAMTDHSQGSLQNPGPAGNHGRLILPHGGSDTRTQGNRQVCIQCVDVHQASACAKVGDQHSETWARNTGVVRTRAALRPVGGDEVAALLCDAAVASLCGEFDGK